MLKSIAPIASSWSIVCEITMAAAPSIATFVRWTHSSAIKASATAKMATANSIQVAFRIVDSWDIPNLDLEPHHPKILRTDGEARVVAVNLPAGEALDDHQVHERAYVVVVDGEAQIGPVGSTEKAGPGFVAHFDPNERHEVRATGDTRLLLFLAPWPGEGHPSQR